MIRKKGLLPVLTALAVAAMVMGCTGENPKTGGQTDGVSREETGTRILAQNSNVGNIVSTDAGMYRIVYEELPDQTWAHRIYYVDYATAREIVLCNDSSCNHDTGQCTGVIQDEDLIFPYLFIYRDKLYVFSPCDESGTTTIVTGDSDAFGETTAQACLYQMDLDGTNRRHVLDFPADVAVEENVYEWKGQLLFCEKKVEKVEGSEGALHCMGEERKLVSLDADSGVLSEVTEFPEELKVCGTYQDELVCKRLIYPDGYTEEDTLDMTYEEWMEVMKKSQNAYVLFDPATGTETEICRISEKDYFDDCMVLDGKLYISTGTPEVLCVDLATGEKENMVIGQGEAYSFVTNLGDRIYCWPEGNADEMYFWDPIRNENTRTDLKVAGTDLPAEILAYNEELLVIVCDGEYIRNEDGSYEIASQEYGIVKKEDLYEGKVVVTPVTMCSDGLN